MPSLFHPADLLIPHNEYLPAWSVVACDQFTSEPDYWQAVEVITTDKPSTYHITLPEIYLSQQTDERIAAINNTMLTYQNSDLFCEFPASLIYVERRLASGAVRKGLVGAVDLEAYDYHAGSVSPIRATEQTVLSRVPPRVHIRENASLELPHIMLLINDSDRAIFGTIDKGNAEVAYDFELMQNGGHITGYVLSGKTAQDLCVLFDNLPGSLKIAVGDGNHSLAAAKACFEAIKAEIGAEAAATHPARYALAEVVDISDDSLKFEPIHRTVFGVDSAKLLAFLREQNGNDFVIPYVCAGKTGKVAIPANGNSLACGALQLLLDRYVAENGGEIDYIHGDDTAAQLGSQAGNISFLLQVFEKVELFSIVDRDGTLPRKAFSMGHAEDKRYYLECRKIR
ncbi:MAG: DUF1015 domain-containing protein [Clostridia bacterium]|nr:DUF1015 domain-containing protein [Clostridia bacterium]